MTPRERENRTRIQDMERHPIFHSPWLSQMIEPGASERALMHRPSATSVHLDRVDSELASISMTPTFVNHPLFEEVVRYRWHSPELKKEARRLVFSLCSSHRAGWERQIDLCLHQLLRLVEQDRFQALMDRAGAMGIPVEHVGRGPLVEHPFRITYQGSEWLVHPVNEWQEGIPFEAHYNKLALEGVGSGFDAWYVAEELPKPTLAERARDGASIAAGAAGTVIGRLATILGVALAGLTLLDPALVGTLNSKAEPGQAEWFIISRWLH